MDNKQPIDEASTSIQYYTLKNIHWNTSRSRESNSAPQATPYYPDWADLL